MQNLSYCQLPAFAKIPFPKGFALFLFHFYIRPDYICTTRYISILSGSQFPYSGDHSYFTRLLGRSFYPTRCEWVQSDWVCLDKAGHTHLYTLFNRGTLVLKTHSYYEVVPWHSIPFKEMPTCGPCILPSSLAVITTSASLSSNLCRGHHPGCGSRAAVTPIPRRHCWFPLHCSLTPPASRH